MAELTPMQIQTSVGPNSDRSLLTRIMDAGLIVGALTALILLLMVLDIVPTHGSGAAAPQVPVMAPSPRASPVVAPEVPKETKAVPVHAAENAKVPKETEALLVHAAEKEETIDVLGEEIKAAEELIEEMEADEETESIEEIELEAEKDGINDSELKKDEYLLEHDTDPLDEEIEEELVEKEKEEIIDEIIEEELDLDDFCPACIWLGVSEISCHDRLIYIKHTYKTKEDAGKLALMKDGNLCAQKDGVLGIWESMPDHGPLVGKAGD